jgi:hypothetical protein
MPANRFIVRGQEELDAIAEEGVSIVGTVRLLRADGDQPPIPTDLYLVYVDVPEAATTPGFSRAVSNGAANQIDPKIQKLFNAKNLNLHDYGPKMRRSFRADMAVAGSVIDEYLAT